MDNSLYREKLEYAVQIHYANKPPDEWVDYTLSTTPLDVIKEIKNFKKIHGNEYGIRCIKRRIFYISEVIDE